MTEDNKQVVQPTEQASQVEPTSTGGEPPKVEVTPPEPSPDEILNQKIAEAVSRALAPETEKSRREIQSAKDKATAEINAALRRARIAEATLGATKAQLQSLDPDVAKEMELAELREKERQRIALEQEEQAAKYQSTVVQTFYDNMNQFVIGLGVNPTDPRIDWAGDASDLLTMQRRILDSVTKIQKEEKKALESSIKDEILKAEKRIKKELGAEDVNSVSTQISGGISGEGIPTDRARFREWIDKLTVDEYAKVKPKIDEMLAKNLIK